MTLAGFFHSFTFNISHSLEFIWSKICLLILPISFLAGLMSLVGWFKKFALWSFKVTKQLSVPFASTLSSIFASLAYLIPSQFILLFLCGVFYMLLLLRFVTGDGILFQADTYLMFYHRKSMFSSMNALSLNLRVTLFENNFLLCGILIFFHQINEIIFEWYIGILKMKQLNPQISWKIKEYTSPISQLQNAVTFALRRS